jgi:hypothetical protein
MNHLQTSYDHHLLYSHRMIQEIRSVHNMMNLQFNTSRSDSMNMNHNNSHTDSTITNTLSISSILKNLTSAFPSDKFYFQFPIYHRAFPTHSYTKVSQSE